MGQAKLRLGAEEGELISSMAVAVLRMNVDPRIPTIPGRRTSGPHQPGKATVADTCRAFGFQWLMTTRAGCYSISLLVLNLCNNVAVSQPLISSPSNINNI